MENNFYNDTIDPLTGAAPASLEAINIEDDSAESVENIANLFVIDIHGKPEYITKKQALSIVCQLNAQFMIEYESKENADQDY